MKIFLNGVFDILHAGHFNMLMLARTLSGGGKVIVAIDEDEKVMAAKGLRRPIFTSHERAKALLDLKIGTTNVVDEVLFFHSDYELENIIRRIKPDYLIKGSDWQDRKVVGAEFAKKVLFFERMNYSTTQIVERVLDRNKILK